MEPVSITLFGDERSEEFITEKPIKALYNQRVRIRYRVKAVDADAQLDLAHKAKVPDIRRMPIADPTTHIWGRMVALLGLDNIKSVELEDGSPCEFDRDLNDPGTIRRLFSVIEGFAARVSDDARKLASDIEVNRKKS